MGVRPKSLDSPHIHPSVRELRFAVTNRRTLSGERFVGIIDNGGMSPRSKDKPTPHELAILRLFVAGMSAKQIATEIHAEPTNVRTSIRSLRRKLGAKNDAHLGALSLLLGFTNAHSIRG